MLSYWKEVTDMPNIYPYNYWILYAAIAALIITLIVSLVQIAKMAKNMIAFIQPKAEVLKKKAKLMQIKTEVINEKRAADAKKNKYIMLALPVLLAVYQAYRDDDEAVGAKGVVKAARTVMNNRSEEAKLVKKISAAIR